jgi:hypothetical protein
LAAYDQGLALGLLLSALAFAIAGDTGAVALFGAVGVAQLIVTATTRYSTRRGAQNFL